jgi:3-oxoacyl-[acyl-carrier-protein] synthase-1
MRRVAVTGRGIVSCIGNSLEEVASALEQGRSGLRRAEDFAQAGLHSQVAGVPSLEGLPPIKRSLRRYMAAPSLYAYYAAGPALAEAGLGAELLASPRTGLVVGSGLTSVGEIGDVVALARERGPRKVPPYTVPRIMGSTTSANLATAFGLRGPAYSIVSACTTSAHCIGHGAELIQFGKLDRVIVGGAEEATATAAMMFEAMGALSTSFNEEPERASRPYDRRRDGFVLAGGAGVLVLEELEGALARGARVHAELVGYGCSSDGSDMVSPHPSGIAAAMAAAREQAGGDIDYINTHATSTPRGDVSELEAMREVFGERLPPYSSTKGLTGHSLGAIGVQEAIYCLLMMERGFVAGCANLTDPDPATHGTPLVSGTRRDALRTAMTNSLGFGGTNASLVFRRWQGKPG